MSAAQSRPEPVGDVPSTDPEVEPLARRFRAVDLGAGRAVVRRTLQMLANKALVQPAAYLVRRLGFRQDVITRVRWLAADDAARYVLDHMMPCAIFDDRYGLLNLSIRQALERPGMWLEFGVFNAKSINYVGKQIGSHGHVIHGFDSFEGLAEDWRGTAALKGRFTLGGKLPRVEPNVRLVKGWFDATIPTFLAARPAEPIAFAHLDSDTYESTKYVLEQIIPRLAAGTILQFDEYLGYPAWRKGEYLAWQEACAAHGIKYRYLGVGLMSVAVEITAVRG